MDEIDKTVDEAGRQRVHIPEITSSLKTLFILRTVTALGLIFAGIVCLYFGSSMLTASLGAQAQSVLFEVAGQLKVTAGGFGAVVMTTSLVPFYLAYLARPMINLTPMPGGGYGINDLGPSTQTLGLTSRSRGLNNSRESKQSVVAFPKSASKSS